MAHEEPEAPPVDDCCEKETYALFGFAAYWAQVLEHSALNLALGLRLRDMNLVSKPLFDDLYAELSRRTLGQLMKAAAHVVSVPDEDQDFLDEALELRNILTHHYFREHAEDLVSEKGRAEMKVELQKIALKFMKADAILQRLYLPLFQKYGVTEAFVEDQLAELKRRADQRDAGE